MTRFSQFRAAGLAAAAALTLALPPSRDAAAADRADAITATQAARNNAVSASDKSPMAVIDDNSAGTGAPAMDPTRPLAASPYPAWPGPIAGAGTAPVAGSTLSPRALNVAPVTPARATVINTYGQRDYAGHTYLIAPGGWYPPVWEDPCGRKRTYPMRGHAEWPGVRVDTASDEVAIYPYPARYLRAARP